MSIEKNTKKSQEIVARLKQSYKDKDLIATGDTVNSIRSEATDSGFKILGASWIELTETGRGPRKSNKESDFLARLEKWRKARGVETPARTLQYLINKYGTNLHQGKDDRFKGTRSNVITDVINDELIAELRGEFFGQYAAKLRTDLKRIMTL